MKTIAILGATGYIGTSLARELAVQKEAASLYLFSRSQEKILHLKETVVELGSQENNYFYTLDRFQDFDYDVIINCTGISSVATLENHPDEVIDVTERVDNLIFEYLKKKPDVLYINMSSGAVYNTTGVGASVMTPADYYAFAKKDAEKRHRVHAEFSIVDIRVFSFFSRFVNTEGHFLMSQIVDAIKNKKIFETNFYDVERDYISPHDLCALVWCVIQKGKQNDVYDAYSLAPVTKFALLEFLKKKYGLEYTIKDGETKKALSQNQSSYIPHDKKAETIGYIPELKSIESIDHEIRALLKL